MEDKNNCYAKLPDKVIEFKKQYERKQNDKLELGMAVILDDNNHIRPCQADLTKHVDGIICGDAVFWRLKDDGKVWLIVRDFNPNKLRIKRDQLVYVRYYDGEFTLNEKEEGWDIHSYYSPFYNQYIGIIYMDDMKDYNEETKMVPVTIRLREVKKLREHNARKTCKKI